MNKKYLIIIIIVIAFAVFFLRDKGDNNNLPTEDVATNNEISTPDNQLAYTQCLEDFSEELCGMFDENQRQDLYNLCSTTEIPNSADDFTIYSELKIAATSWWDTEIEDNQRLYLPFEPENNFANCSESVQERFREIYDHTSNYDAL